MGWQERQSARVLAYNEFAKDHPHSMQLSKERSGRVWLSTIMQWVTGQKSWNLEVYPTPESGFGAEAEKYYFNSHYYPYLELFPHGKYILLIRDPRDAFCSSVDFGVSKGVNRPLLDDEELLKQLCREWKKYFEPLLQMDTLVVQYEQLCFAPVATIRRICKHLNKTVAVGIMDVINKLEKRWWIDDKPPTNQERYEEHCLKWRRHPCFADGHNDIVWEQLGDIMMHYGYLKDGHGEVLFNR